MKHLISILILTLLVNIVHAQNEETKLKIESIEGKWKIDAESGNAYHFKSIKKPAKSDDEIFDSIRLYLPKFYENIKTLYKEDKYEISSLDSVNHKLTVNGKSGIVYSLFSKDLFTQDIMHILTIWLTSDSIEVKIEHKVFIKKVGLRNPTSEKLELKDLYPINPESDDKDFYGNSFYNLHEKMTNKLNDFESYIRSI